MAPYFIPTCLMKVREAWDRMGGGGEGRGRGKGKRGVEGKGWREEKDLASVWLYGQIPI